MDGEAVACVWDKTAEMKRTKLAFEQNLAEKAKKSPKLLDKYLNS